ncbi:U3 snoRNP protein, partial [Spiromyces aspiralis]
KSTIRAQTPELLANINVCFVKESDNLTQNKVLLRGLEILSRISEHVSDAGNAKALLDLLLPLLRRPARVVSEKTKAHILEIFLKFLELVISDAAEHATAGQPESPRQRLFTQFYGLTSFGFSTIKSRDCRVLLCLVLEKLAKVDPCQGSGCTPVPLMPVVEVVTDLNAYSTKRLEEPDFDRRLAAFSRINDECWCDPNKLDARAWLPVLHNLVYFSQDVDEMSIRSNASHGLTRFIERVAQVLGAQPTPDEAEVQQFRSHMVHIVYVAIKRALDSQHKVVRSEYLAVLAHAVRKCGDKFVQLGDLRALDHEDEEASFFFNIQHIQLHRRIRALKRLVILINPDQDTGDDSAMEVEENAPTQRAAHWFRTSTLTKLLVPLFERFVFESDIQADHSLVAETINTLGAIGLVLPWESYYALLRKYLRIVRRKPDLERPLFRIVVSFLNNFHFDIKSAEASASVAEAHDA